MLDEYDFSNAEFTPNPFVKLLKTNISINLNNETVAYFKQQERDTGIPYDTLINICLSKYVKEHEKK